MDQNSYTVTNLPNNTPKIAIKWIGKLQEEVEYLKEDNSKLESMDYLRKLAMTQLKKDNQKLKAENKLSKSSMFESIENLLDNVNELKIEIDKLKEENKKLKEDLKLFGEYY